MEITKEITLNGETFMTVASISSFHHVLIIDVFKDNKLIWSKKYDQYTKIPHRAVSSLMLNAVREYISAKDFLSAVEKELSLWDESKLSEHELHEVEMNNLSAQGLQMLHGGLEKGEQKDTVIQSIKYIDIMVSTNHGEKIITFTDMEDPAINIVNTQRIKDLRNGTILHEDENYQQITFNAGNMTISDFEEVGGWITIPAREYVML